MNSSCAPVSVIIPCYNCALTIDRAIQSVLKQTLKPFEVILVDDASSDDTKIILAKFASKYSGWIKVLTLPDNQGVSNARNAGWEQSTQPYLAFLDSDDSWHEKKLEIQYRFFLQYTDLVMISNRSRYLEKENDEQSVSDSPLMRLLDKSSFLYRNPIVTSSVMLQREIPFRFVENSRYSEDYYLWMQMVFSGMKIGMLNTEMVYAYKPFYDSRGLSSKLLLMEKGELSNFVKIYKSKQISFFECGSAIIFSICKFIRRVVIMVLNR